MAKKEQDQQKRGRNYDQMTNGTSSAGTMGAGGTGGTGGTGGAGQQGGARSGASQQAGSVGGMQSGGRTDDLLSGGAEADANAQGFAAGERTRDLVRGTSDLGSMNSINPGNRQAEETRGSGEGDDMQSGGAKGATGPASVAGEHARNKQGRSGS